MKQITIREMRARFKKDYAELFERDKAKLSLSWRIPEDIGNELHAILPEFTTGDTQIDPLLYQLSLNVPLIFDHRKIPKNYNGFKVVVSVSGFESYPEWEFGNMVCDNYEGHMDPQRYINFVNRCASEIREKLNAPEMTAEEMLDAICFGDFRKYKEDYDKVMNEKEDRLITARKFIAAFKKFLASDSEKPGESVSASLLKDFSGNSRSKIILGNQKYGKVSPLGNSLEKTFNNRIECRTEYDKLDLILATPDHIDQSKNHGFYPKSFDMIIEHENNYKRCWQEMIRLTSIKAKLKVLITYNNPADENQKHTEIVDLLNTNFAQIIKQSNWDYPENRHTQYLLIIGQKDYAEPKNLTWKFYAYDYEGNYKLIE
jgi:hypothetical protein